MAKVQKINVFSLAKFQAVLLGVFGLALGVLYSFGGLVIDTLVTLGWVVSNETPGLSFGTILAFGALIGIPLVTAFLGFVTGAIWALLYNLIARYAGGIEFELEE